MLRIHPKATTVICVLAGLALLPATAAARVRRLPSPKPLRRFEVDVPREWKAVQVTPDQWYYEYTRPNGQHCWFMFAIHRHTPPSAPQDKYIKTPEPILSADGTPWNMYTGVYPSGRDYICHEVTLQESDGLDLTAAHITVGFSDFTTSGERTLEDAQSFRSMLTSLRVVGMLGRREAEPAGPGLSVPPNLVRAGFDRRGLLGVTITTPQADQTKRNIPKRPDEFMAKTYKGARVAEITPGSAAELAGVQSGDHIYRVDKLQVEDAPHLRRLLFWREPGEEVLLSINRNGADVQTKVTLAGAADPKAPQQPVTPQEPASHPDGVPLDELLSSGKVTVNNNTGRGTGAGSVDRAMRLPGLSIGGMAIQPATVAKGARFSFILDITAQHPEKTDAQLPVTMHHEIIRDSKTVYRGSPESFDVPNGKPYRITKNVNAAKTAGEYSLRVTLEFETSRRSAMESFRIE